MNREHLYEPFEVIYKKLDECPKSAHKHLFFEEALSAYNIAGELAIEKTEYPGTFQIEFLNSLYSITPADITARKQVTAYE